MYKALRPFKYQTANGEVRMTKPGDSIPEAGGWKNLKVFIERRWICREGEEVNKKHYSAKIAPPAAKPKITTEPMAKLPRAKTADLPEPPKPALFKESARKHTEESLGKMSKKELKELAISLGINPQQSKADLVISVLAVQ